MARQDAVRRWDIYAGLAEGPRYTVSAASVDEAMAEAKRLMPGACRVVESLREEAKPQQSVWHGVRFLGREAQDAKVVGRY